MISRRPPMPAVCIVAEVNFQAEATAKGNEFVKRLIIPHHPRHGHDHYRQHCGKSWCEPARVLPVTPEPHPRTEKRGTHHPHGSVSAPKPASAPKAAQSHTLDESSSRSASKKTKLINSVVSVVAQMKSAEK